MKKSYKITALVFAALTVTLLLCSCLKNYDNIPKPSDSFYVYDETSVLDSELKEYIIGKNADLYNKCGGQIVVACVKTTGTEDIADYAYDMFNKWGIGSKEKNNGILILLSINEDDYWVLQGKGLENLIQSGTIKLLLDEELEPYFAKKQYGAGVRALFDALIKEYEQIYSVSVEQLPAESAAAQPSPSSQSSTAEASGGGNPLWNFVSSAANVIVGFAVFLLSATAVISVIIGIFILIATFFGFGAGEGSFRIPFIGRRNVNPHSFRSTGGSYHSGGGFNFGGSSGSSHRSGGFSSGSHRSGGGFSGGSHHSGGGGSSRGGGAGRR